MSEEKIVVQNLTNNNITYIDDNGGLKRRFVFRAQQSIPMDKDIIDRMSYDTGGARLLKEFLSVKNEEVRESIGIPGDQIEYDWTSKDVIELLKNGEEDALKDALDFAPQGIIDMIVDEAVALPLSDRNKVEIITEMTGCNVESMISNKLNYEKAMNATSEKIVEKPSKRRIAKKAEPGHRVQSAKEIEASEQASK